MEALQAAPGLGERAYQAILDSICDGKLPAGTHLVQEQLAEQLGVSRQPIQQAMALLRADGLVEDVGRRGLRVTRLDLDRMRHHYDIRAALDGLAARTAAVCARDGGLPETIARRGRDILDDGRAAVRSGDVRAMILHDLAFHTLIYEASGNPLLARTAEPHWRFLRRAMGDVLRHAEPPEDVWRQHADILDAVLAGDAETAEERAVAHARMAAEMLSSAMSARDGSGTVSGNGR